MHTHVINECMMKEFAKIKASGKDCLIFLNNEHQLITQKDKNNPLQEEEFFGIKALFFLCDESMVKDEFKLPFCAWYKKQASSLGECFWFNTDYSFYILKKYFPNYDFYWQIQYDCYFNDKDYTNFFAPYEEDMSDLIISHFRNEIIDQSKWCWTFDTSWIYKDDKNANGSLWTAPRMSVRLVDALYTLRQEHGRIYNNLADTNKAQWLLCEIFVTTACVKLGFSAKPLLNDATRAEPEYDLNDSRLFEKLDSKLYHPIKGNFLQRLEELKQSFSYKLGEAFIYVNKKPWYQCKFLKFYFKARKLKKEFKGKI